LTGRTSRLLWFVGLWATGVAATLTVAGLLKLVFMTIFEGH